MFCTPAHWRQRVDHAALLQGVSCTCLFVSSSQTRRCRRRLERQSMVSSLPLMGAEQNTKSSEACCGLTAATKPQAHEDIASSVVVENGTRTPLGDTILIDMALPNHIYGVREISAFSTCGDNDRLQFAHPRVKRPSDRKVKRCASVSSAKGQT